MRLKLKKCLAACTAFAALLSGMAFSLAVKCATVDEVYGQSARDQLAFEAGQYVKQISGAIRYGKQLDAYYDMDALLKRVLRASSYLSGAYVVSAGGALCGAAGDLERPIPTPDSFPESAGAYRSLEAGEDAWLRLEIEGADAAAGWLLLRVNRPALDARASKEKQVSAAVSAAIHLELAAAALLAVLRAGGEPRPRAALRFCVLLSLLVLTGQAADAGLEAAKIRWETRAMAEHSAHRVVQTVRAEVDALAKKGARREALVDLNSYLRKLTRDTEVLESLYCDRDGVIRGEYARAYVERRVRGYTARARLAACATACACALACLAAGLAPSLAARRRGQKRTDGKGVDV